MTQTKHTPGPWTIFEGYDDTAIGSKIHRPNQVSPRSVGTVCHHGEIIPENGERTGYTQATAEDRANARLIAAAPELLEALERVLASCCEREEDLDGEGRARLKRARAAIAKATGAA